jgi:hypothetical protein
VMVSLPASASRCTSWKISIQILAIFRSSAMDMSRRWFGL